MSKELTDDVTKKFIAKMMEIMLKHYIDYSNDAETEELDYYVGQCNNRGETSKYYDFIENQELVHYYSYVAAKALGELWSDNETILAEYLGELAKGNKEKATCQFRSNLAMRSCEQLEISTIKSLMSGKEYFNDAEEKDKEAYGEETYNTLDENYKILGVISNSLGSIFEEDFQCAGFCVYPFEKIDGFIVSKIKDEKSEIL